MLKNSSGTGGKILIIEDDPAMLKFLRANLSARGYKVYTVVDGLEALKAAEMELPDLIILDLMLPGMEGVEVLDRLREWSGVPVLVVSARGSESDKVLCLDKGADDYISKPFDLEELLARVRVLLRRMKSHSMQIDSQIFQCGEMQLDFDAMQLSMNGKPVKLTPTEYRTLRLLATNHGKVLTHNMILSNVWGSEYQDSNEYIYVIIGRLRKKIEAEKSTAPYILTVPGIGYCFKSE